MINASKARENLKFDRAIRLTESIKQASKLIESASVRGQRCVYIYNIGSDILKSLMDHITKHGYEVEFNTESDVRASTGDYLKIRW